MKLAIVAVLVAATACSQRVYSPPSQAFELGGVRALPLGREAMDVEVSRHSEIFDPAIEAGQARLHVGLGDNVEGTAEGMVAAVDASGTSKADRQFYAGRAGLRMNPSRGPFTITSGAGMGYAPSGGGFAAVDTGIQVGFDNCVLVPVAAASAFFSQPFAPRPIDVSIDNGSTYDTPKRTVGGVLRFGLRLSLSPSACRSGAPTSWLTLGLSATTLADADSSSTMMGLGGGIQIPL